MSNVVLNHPIRVRVYCYGTNQLAINILHFYPAAVVGIITTAQFAVSVDGLLAPVYKPCMHSSAKYLGVDAADVSSLPTPVPDQSAAHTGFGTAGAAAAPQQVSGVITKRTAFTGRKFRGRMFIPFPDESFNTGTPPSPTAGYVAVLDALAALALQPIIVSTGPNSATFNPCVMHGSTGVSFDRVTTWTSQLRWGTQRRRGDYGRTNPIWP